MIANTDRDRVKMLLVGESGVGKTNIALRFIESPFVDKHEATIGENEYFKNVYINNKKIKFIILDTAGQERFRKIVSSYYKLVQVIILVYDVTNQESFNELKNFWIEDIKKSNANPKCK